MNRQRFNKQAARIGRLEDEANVKAAFLMASRKVMPRIAMNYDLRGVQALDIDAAIESALLETESAARKDMEERTARAIKGVLARHRIERPGLCDDFLDAIAREMAVR